MAAESDKDNKPKVVVNGKTVNRHKVKGLRRLFSKKRVIKTLVVLLIIGGIAAGYYIYYTKKHPKTVVIDGKTYKVNLQTTPDKLNNNPGPTTTEEIDNVIKQLQDAVSKNPSSGLYVGLARLYAQKGDKTQATEYYKKAIAALDPNLPDKDYIVQSMNDELTKMQGGQ